MIADRRFQRSATTARGEATRATPAISSSKEGMRSPQPRTRQTRAPERAWARRRARPRVVEVLQRRGQHLCTICRQSDLGSMDAHGQAHAHVATEVGPSPGVTRRRRSPRTLKPFRLTRLPAVPRGRLRRTPVTRQPCPRRSTSSITAGRRPQRACPPGCLRGAAIPEAGQSPARASSSGRRVRDAHARPTAGAGVR